MNKKLFFTIIIVILVLIILAAGAFIVFIMIFHVGTHYNNESPNPNSGDLTEPPNLGINNDTSIAPILIYKTKADYFDLVAARYYPKTGTVAALRPPINFTSNGELWADVTYRHHLYDGYILDYGVTDINVAFLDFTQEEYDKITHEDVANPSRTDIMPLSLYLSNYIKDNDPFLEFYDCSKARSYYADYFFEEKLAYMDSCLKNKEVDLDIYEYYELKEDYLNNFIQTGHDILRSDLDGGSGNQEVLDESQYPHRYLYLSAKYEAEITSCSSEFSENWSANLLSLGYTTYEEELFYYINENIVKTGELPEKCIKLK